MLYKFHVPHIQEYYRWVDSAVMDTDIHDVQVCHQESFLVMTVNKNQLLNAKYNKEQFMTGSNKTEQFLHENITWTRLLYFFTQENSFLKTRLSEVVDRETDQLFIAHAEQFQNDFVLKDEHILDIGKDIKGQQENLQQAFTNRVAPDQKTCKLQEKLRNEMSYLETEFSDLKRRFNIYLLSIV